MLLNPTNHLLTVAAFLTLCVVSFVHVFLFPLYDEKINAQKLPKRGYVSDYEHILCQDKIPYINMKTTLRLQRNQRKTQPCPRDGIVTVYQGGRLGNQMFEYAGVWAVARRTGLDPYVPGCIRRRLDKLFENLSVPTLNQISHCPMQWNTLVHSVDQWNFTNQSILLHRYYGNAEVIIPWLQDIRHEFTIKKNLTQRAQNILRKAELKLIKIKNNVSHINSDDSTSITYIGVHVRRTDYRAHLWRARRHRLVGSKYFFTAMKYFENKYVSVIFIVISDDPAWCHKHLGKHRNVYIVSKIDSTNSPEQDFAVMAACNHSIIDYGTFGVWGAILAGGETIVHNITGWISTEVGELLPTWHLL